MVSRSTVVAVLAACVLAASAAAQTKPANPSPIADSAAKEVKGLTAEDFPERQAALAHLKTLVADQIKQRAEIQDVLAALQNDLAKQQRALAMVSNDEEAQAQIAGLLEMERGLAGWTIQTMSEPLERRTVLLNWGLTKEHADVLARSYDQNKRTRLQGIKDLAKLDDDGASWTLGRLINDSETPVRAQAMAVAWSRKPAVDVIDALWFRAVSGPLAYAAQAPAEQGSDRPTADPLKVDFPGAPDPMEFSEDDESGQFLDSQLAGDVLVHLNSDLVAGKIKDLLAQRVKANKTLSLIDDPDWTLVTHWLVETYKIKDAIPVLAAEALSDGTEQLNGDMNGREFAWSDRTLAIGTLCTLIGKDPADFGLFRAKQAGEPREWMWAVDTNVNVINGQPDAAAVNAFFAFWHQHHAEYGVKEEPQPSPIRTLRPGRGRLVAPMIPGNPGAPVIDLTPVPAKPAPAPAAGG